jgi:hypothetical protein
MNRDRIAVLVMTTTTLLAVTVLGPVATSGASLSSPTTQAAAENPQRTVTSSQKRSAFAGHRPGRIYLGMSCGVECPKRESHLRANVGLKRWFKQWGNWNGVAEAIKEDRRKNRRTWISIEGPRGGAPSGWLAVAQGDFDRQIRDLARVLKRQDRQPIFLSFDHEMSNKASESQASWWARGFNRFHDVLKRAHALRRVALAPIHASWLFSKFNGGKSPAKWLPPGVLRRSSFVAVDVYQNWKGESFGSRISRVDRWLDRHGHPRMKIGVGETGATNGLGGDSAASWLNQSLRWAAKNRHKMVAISYFNSTANSASSVYWPLDESSQKVGVYRTWLKKNAYINRVG